jgi:hypothetical protein
LITFIDEIIFFMIMIIQGNLLLFFLYIVTNPKSVMPS